MTFDESLLEEFQDQLGYTFLNRNLLYQVLTTPSYSNENDNIDHNESFATLGDAVAKLIITQHAIQDLKMTDKGTITSFKQQFESRTVMTQRYLDYFKMRQDQDNVILKILKLGKGEREKLHYLENNFFGEFLEALFGAIFLDTFFDLVRTSVIVKRILKVI
ncbi:MAG: hypothetical protein GPJ54_12600 [Candidatus Heimdallarchaeota archaeon]|nr:hypothetical protein [Candidatus Heimdallarchaeota archaeon]